MALPSSGQVSFQDIQDTHGGSHPISLSEYYGKYNVSNTQGPTTGALGVSHLHGTSPSIAGGWSAWSGWGSCSVSCGGGTQDRTRSCNNPSSSYGGADCSGSTSESQTCNTQSCCSSGSWSYGYSGSTTQTGTGSAGEYEFTNTHTRSFTALCTSVTYTLTGSSSGDIANAGNKAYVEFYNGASLVHTSSKTYTGNQYVADTTSVSGSFTGTVDNYKIRNEYWTTAAGGPCTWSSSGTLSYSAS
jgi:hypothetical protein